MTCAGISPLHLSWSATTTSPGMTTPGDTRRLTVIRLTAVFPPLIGPPTFTKTSYRLPTCTACKLPLCCSLHAVNMAFGPPDHHAKVEKHCNRTITVPVCVSLLPVLTTLPWQLKVHKVKYVAVASPICSELVNHSLRIDVRDSWAFHRSQFQLMGCPSIYSACRHHNGQTSFAHTSIEPKASYNP